MPLGEKGGGDRSSSLCGVETRFNPFMKDVFDHNITVGGFDFVVAPLMLPHYRPSLQVQCQFGSFASEPRLPYAKSDLSLSPSLWNAYVIGKISTWIDLDSDNQILRKDSEIVLQQEIAWASYLSLQACLLPAPKGTTWANYARCVNQILQSVKHMELWLRIPLGKPDDDSSPSFSTSVDYWKTWNSFRLLCDHDHKLLVALDNLGILPSNDSLSRWYGEPVTAFIIHTDSFFTSDHDDLKHLSEELQKLITDFLNHNIQIIISGEKAYTIASEEDIDDNFSAAGSQRHPLRPYLDYVISLYQQLDPLSEQECLQFAQRDVLQPTIQPLKNNLGNAVYENFEKDMNKYDEYERAICQALQDRVPDEKASTITTVLVVAGSGRGPLVRASLNASKETGRKLKVYAVEKNSSAVAYLNKCCLINGWEDIVTVVHSDVRSWNAPESADILVSALLGCFGDNELSPECLDGAQRFLKEDGISIPSSYTSFLQPVTASRIYNKVKAKKDILSFETAFVVNMHSVARLAPSQPVFTFTHPKPSDNESNMRYESLQFVIPDDAEPAMVHGFAGYFDATLYKDVHLAIEPSKATPGVFTWYAMFFPLRTPICVHRGSILEVHFWRCCDSSKVWYEWCVTSPTLSIVHNSNGHAHCLEL